MIFYVTAFFNGSCYVFTSMPLGFLEITFLFVFELGSTIFVFFDFVGVWSGGYFTKVIFLAFIIFTLFYPASSSYYWLSLVTRVSILFASFTSGNAPVEEEIAS